MNEQGVISYWIAYCLSFAYTVLKCNYKMIGIRQTICSVPNQIIMTIVRLPWTDKQRSRSPQTIPKCGYKSHYLWKLISDSNFQLKTCLISISCKIHSLASKNYCKFWEPSRHGDEFRAGYLVKLLFSYSQTNKKVNKLPRSLGVMMADSVLVMSGTETATETMMSRMMLAFNFITLCRSDFHLPRRHRLLDLVLWYRTRVQLIRLMDLLLLWRQTILAKRNYNNWGATTFLLHFSVK